jgi:retinol dehydrogenase 12
MSDMTGKTCLVTGATSGIGLETAFALVKQGARVIGVGRDPARCADAATRITAVTAGVPGADVRYEVADLSSQVEVRGLAARVGAAEPRLDVLVNNAGLFTFRRTESIDGIEMQLAVNHLAPFLLTHELLPLLAAAPRARVVFLSSGSHFPGRVRWSDPGRRRFYNGLAAYEQSKLTVLMIARELARRLGPESSIDTYAADPGLVRTDIGMKDRSRIVGWVWGLRTRGGISAAESAAAVAWLASEPSIAGITGRYWKERAQLTPSSRAADPEACRRLWELSERLCAPARSCTAAPTVPEAAQPSAQPA